MNLENLYNTCLDCIRLGGCKAAYDHYKMRGPESVLKLTCPRHKRCHPITITSRLDALEFAGILALRGLIESHTTKEDMAVTRTEREAELKTQTRVELRKSALKTGMSHKDSLKVNTDQLITYLLDYEFPEGTSGAESKKGRKRTTSKQYEKDEPADESTTSTTGDGIAIVEAFKEILQPHEKVLDAQSDALDEIIKVQVGIVRMLHSIMCIHVDPEAATEAVQDAGLGDYLEDPEDPQ